MSKLFFRLFILALLIPIDTRQTRAAIPWKEIGIGTAIIIPASIALSYIIKHQKIALRSNQQVIADAQHSINSTKTIYQPFLDIIDQMKSDLNESSLIVLDYLLFKKATGRSDVLPWYSSDAASIRIYFLKQNIIKAFNELKQHSDWLRIRIGSAMAQLDDSLKAELQKMADDSRLWMSKLIIIQETLASSYLCRAMQITGI